MRRTCPISSSAGRIPSSSTPPSKLVFSGIVTAAGSPGPRSMKSGEVESAKRGKRTSLELNFVPSLRRNCGTRRKYMQVKEMLQRRSGKASPLNAGKAGIPQARHEAGARQARCAESLWNGDASHGHRLHTRGSSRSQTVTYREKRHLGKRAMVSSCRETDQRSGTRLNEVTSGVIT